MIESNVWLERAGLFELLAKSFSFPAFDLAAALASGEYSKPLARCATHGELPTCASTPCSNAWTTNTPVMRIRASRPAYRIHPAVHRHPRTSGFALRKLLEGDCRGEGPRSVSQSRNVGSGKRDARGGRRK
mgnify:CR=1 FL=1